MVARRRHRDTGRGVCDNARYTHTLERETPMPQRPQPTLTDLAQHYGLLGEPPYVSALAQQREGAQPCDLCRTPWPTHLLVPEAYQEWAALCPACWRLATAHTALELAREAAMRAPDAAPSLLRLTRMDQ